MSMQLNNTENSDSESVSLELTSKSAPLQPVEKTVLLELIRSQASVLEDKRTDFGTATKKAEAWIDIKNKSCSQPGTSIRSVKNLQTWWKNSKIGAKKNVTKKKRLIRKTGGGVSKFEVPTETDTIMAIIPSQMNPLENPFDCDNEEIRTDDNGEVGPDAEVSTMACRTINKQDCTGNNLQEVGVAQKRKYKDARSSVVDMEEEEHKLRLKVIQVQYEDAVLQKSLTPKKIDYLKEEHDVKMQRLSSA